MASFFHSYPVLLPLVVWCIGQTLKVLGRLLFLPKFNKKLLLTSGGMPSVHAMFMSACLTMVGMMSGVQSLLFAVTFAGTAVVLYDATHVRYEAGKHARILNTLSPKEILNSSLGHTTWEMIVGVTLGGVLTILFLLG